MFKNNRPYRMVALAGKAQLVALLSWAALVLLFLPTTKVVEGGQQLTTWQRVEMSIDHLSNRYDVGNLMIFLTLQGLAFAIMIADRKLLTWSDPNSKDKIITLNTIGEMMVFGAALVLIGAIYHYQFAKVEVEVVTWWSKSVASLWWSDWGLDLGIGQISHTLSFGFVLLTMTADRIIRRKT